MQEKDVKKIIKIIVILGIIFCAISFILSWRGFSMSFFGISTGGDFYPWGVHTYINVPSSFSSTTGAPQSVDIWSIFYTIDPSTQETGSTSFDGGNFTFTSTSYEPDNAVIALAILTFIFCILTIVAGIMALKKKRACFFAGIRAIISIVLFIIYMSIIFSQDPTGAASSFIPYTIGFFLMIISAVMFFIAYGLNRIIPSLMTKPASPPKENEPPTNSGPI